MYLRKDSELHFEHQHGMILRSLKVIFSARDGSDSGVTCVEDYDGIYDLLAGEGGKSLEIDSEKNGPGYITDVNFTLPKDEGKLIEVVDGQLMPAPRINVTKFLIIMRLMYPNRIFFFLFIS